MQRARYGSVASVRGDIQAVALAGAITDMYIVGRARYLVRRAFATRAPYYPGTTAFDDSPACSNRVTTPELHHCYACSSACRFDQSLSLREKCAVRSAILKRNSLRDMRVFKLLKKGYVVWAGSGILR